MLTLHRASLRWLTAFAPASARIKTESRAEVTALGYCRECRKKVKIHKPGRITLRSSPLMVQHACPQCGTRVFLIS